MGSSYKDMVDKAFESRTVGEILDASPAALQGVSESDARKLEEAFGVRTVRDMAQLSYFHFAEALMAAQGQPDYDPGPPPEWEVLFTEAPIFHDKWPDRFRWEFGPVFYRGRLDGTARVLVIGQDPSTDEAIARRAFVGRSGQRLQGLLNRIGVDRSYVIVNTFIYSIYGQFDNEMKGISLDPRVLDYRNRMLDRIVRENNIEAVIAIGAAARHAVENWPSRGTLPVFNLTHPSAPEETVTVDWNKDLPQIRQAVTPDEGVTVDDSLYGETFAPEDHTAIPRRDLPFGIPAWHGTGGTRSRRPDKKSIIWTAPD